MNAGRRQVDLGDTGSGFDRRDFAPPGTKFPLEPSDRNPRPARGRTGGPRDRQSPSGGPPPWLRWVLLGVGVVVLGLLAMVVIGRQADDTAPAEGVAATAAADGPSSRDDATDSTADGAPEVADPDPVEGDRLPDANTAADTGGTDAEPSAGSGSGEVGTIDPELQGAAGFAVQFANSYLNYDEAQPDVRARELAAYLAPGLDAQLGWSGTGRQLAALVIALRAEPTEDGAVVVTVAAQVTGTDAPRWVHLAVPLRQDDRARWAVTAPPAFVPRPSPGNPTVPATPASDDELGAQLTDAVTQAFVAFGTSATVDLPGITAEDARIRGLDGQFAFVRLAELVVHDGDDTARTAIARVVWRNDIAGGEIEQTYRLDLTAAGNAWLIGAITIG